MSQGHAALLLKWYDENARALPWRVSPADRLAGKMPDPYKVWLSEVMLQQTTVVTVGPYYQRFIELWPDLEALASASDEQVMGEWAGLGYYARARNLLKCARIVSSEFGGVFPETARELIKLPGIGPYTAAAISSIAFDRSESVVDGNVERVMARVFNVHTPLPMSKPKLLELAASLVPDERPGDYAQASMDLGAVVCAPANPSCALCPWEGLCLARSAGTQFELPKKTPRKQKPTRFGIVYVVRRADGAWLLERRPEKGLLGGMLAWPGSEWTDEPVEAPPVDANWHMLNEEVRHVFTHFNLRLCVKVATMEINSLPSRGEYLSSERFRPSDLPTVMRKVYNFAMTHLVNSK
ncbi:MAG: A/G-specific adenine glycosylase [Roseovarius sp.]|nr:A/G-specific adenine glycosylase [Roseovarius sp.]